MMLSKIYYQKGLAASGNRPNLEPNASQCIALQIQGLGIIRNPMRIPARSAIAAAALVLAFVLETGLQAGVVPVYSNFPYSPDSGYILEGSRAYLGSSFSPSEATTLDHVAVPLFFQSNTLASTLHIDEQVTLQVYLYGDAGGSPGSELGSLGTVTVDSASPAPGNLYSTPSSASAGLTLDPNQTYWLVLANNNSQPTGISWGLNESGVNGFAQSTDGTTWTPGNPGSGVDTSPAFEVYGMTVPEPGGLLAGAFLVVPLALRGIRNSRNRKRAPGQSPAVA
jgi:hypothetical protein